MKRLTLIAALVIIAAALATAPAALAQDNSKWLQPPDPAGNAVPYVYAPGMPFVPTINTVVDDWQCLDGDRHVTGVRWWGAYYGWDPGIPPEIVPIGTPSGKNPSFHLGIWTDVPVQGETTFNYPGQEIWSCNVTPTEGFVFRQERPEGPGEWIFEYSAVLPQENWFDQAEGETYWLSVVPMDPGALGYNFWSWATSAAHWNGYAVWSDSVDTAFHPVAVEGLPGLDLAFELTSQPVPLPGAVWLMGAGLVGLLGLKRRKR